VETGGQPAEIDLWRVDLGQSPEWAEGAAKSLLADHECERGGSEPTEVWRRRVVARVALRIVLSRRLGQPARALTIVRGPNGKPELAGGAAHFSLSRAGACCLIGVTSLGPIGIDVERAMPLGELEGVARRRFAASEAEAILALRGDRRLRAFYNCWTRKEAYLKATGAGLSGALAGVVATVTDEGAAFVSLQDDDPSEWSLAAVEAGPGLAAAVAVRSVRGWTAGVLTARELDLPASTAFLP
jgi:4'-phosphopantetheinyl transferase